MTGLIIPEHYRGNPLRLDEDPAQLFVDGHGGFRCDLVDVSVRLINPPRCPKKAIWRGLTECIRRHETTELLCYEHKLLAVEGGAWWKCDVCGQRMGKSTVWARL